MEIGVVVPAYNEEDSIRETLDSLAAADELVVVGGGEDATLEVARSHEAVDRVIEDEGPSGPAIARNDGAREVSTEVIAFTDADTVVCPGWLEKHLSHYEDDEVIGAGGPIRPKNDSFKHRLLFKLLSDYWYRISWKFGFIQQSGNNASFRREDFMEERGFDEDIGFMEDTELSLRMKKHGRIVYDPDAWVETSVRRQAEKGYFRLFLQYFRAYFDRYVLGKNLEEGYFEEV